jgi:hypothetical protein
MAVKKQNAGSGFGYGLGVLGKLPGDREELTDPGCGVAVDAGEDVLEIGVRINAIHLAGADEGVEDGSGLSAAPAPNEKMVLSTNHQVSDDVLRGIS